MTSSASLRTVMPAPGWPRSRRTSASREPCLTNWMRQAEIEAGTTPGTTKAEAEELRAARRRIRLLEQENEVLRRAAAYLSQAK